MGDVVVEDGLGFAVVVIVGAEVVLADVSDVAALAVNGAEGLVVEDAAEFL